jgi:hypothetical protein
MKSSPRPPREYDPDATVDARMLPAPAVRDKPRCKIGLIDHTTPHLSEDTRSLLRVRLRGATTIASLAFGAFLLWNLLPYADDPPSSLILPAHIATFAVVTLCAAWVWRPCGMCVWTLRIVEALLVAVPAAFFLLLTAQKIAGTNGTPHPVNPNAPWIILVFSYSLFIPNNWRRALVINGILCLIPIVTLLTVIAVNPAVRELYDAGNVVPLALEMAVTCAAATYGTHLMFSLRREAFEARQLGQYRLGKLLGSGGMGDVYLGEHQMLKRPCAIKVIRPGATLDPKSLTRFEREVMAMARLSHPNTVEVYDYGRTDDGTFFYVMEYLPGMTLHDLVDKHGALPPARVIHFLRQTCAALAEAHALGMLHRDIKPSNIFAAYRGGVCDVAKLLDFGLVKRVSESNSARITQDGTVAGTPQFMSPEQASSKPLDARSDIYSLGAVGYFLLTGRPPFDDPSPLSVLIAHARDPVQPPSELRPDVPKDLEQVLLRCLAKDPADRFPDALALDEALAACSAACGWTAADALRWWTENEGGVIPPAPAVLASEPTAVGV